MIARLLQALAARALVAAVDAIAERLNGEPAKKGPHVPPPPPRKSNKR